MYICVINVLFIDHACIYIINVCNFNNFSKIIIIIQTVNLWVMAGPDWSVKYENIFFSLIFFVSMKKDPQWALNLENIEFRTQCQLVSQNRN